MKIALYLNDVWLKPRFAGRSGSQDGRITPTDSPSHKFMVGSPSAWQVFNQSPARAALTGEGLI